MLALAALLIATGAAAQVYRWTDAHGRTVYGDKPPPGVNAQKVENSVSVVPGLNIDPAVTQAPRTTPPTAVETRPAAPGNTSEESRAERRARMIARCKANRGVDCEDRIDALLDGPIPDAQGTYPIWGWRYHRPVPPIAPKPRPEEPKRREPLAAPMPGTVPRTRPAPQP